MKKELTDLILARLHETKDQCKQDFFQPQTIPVARYFILDKLLPDEIAMEIYSSFPKPEDMSLLSSPGKIKSKYYHLKDAASIIQNVLLATQDPKVVAAIEDITEIKNQIPDQSTKAGGISVLTKGYYLNPHLDISHDVESKRYYRTINFLYYVTPDWKLENGGNLELWDKDIKKCIIIPSIFNRLVIMETNTRSWHAVNPVKIKANRCCVFNYYFSEHSPENKDYVLKGSIFRPRPEQKIRRAICFLKEKIFSL
ncbi:MAG: 2OG-Fe(II) oxygenase [Legionella sp.]|jgi:Rps23 Pro-64 3,4-dihydroxylase Tpa1-like proline 4-hydroxylase